MGPWLDFLMLALALGAGWLGWALLTLAGWRPAGWRLPLPTGSRAPLGRSQAVDSDR